MSVELALLNAVLAKRDLSILTRQGLDKDAAWPEQVDAYRYVRRHLADYGEMPDVASVVRACPSFEAYDSGESIETLCAKLHDRNLKLAQRRILEEAAKKYATSGGYELQRYLRGEIDKLDDLVHARTGVGAANWSRHTDRRRQTYDRLASGEFGSSIPLFGDEIDDAVGGFHRGSYVTFLAWTKRGKSFSVLHAGLRANRSGYRVLALLAESTKEESLFRLDTLEFGVTNRGLSTGSLDSNTYQTYVRKLDELNEANRPDFIIRTPDDWPNGLTIEQVESDIELYRPDVVIIDQFSLMTHRGGDDAKSKAATSRRLKLMFARLNIVGIVVGQASGEYGKRVNKREEGEGDVQELDPPTEADYSETIAIIQDATQVIAFDSTQWRDPTDGRFRGKARMIVRISRTGGAGTSVDLTWCPDDGIIEPRTPMDAF